MMKTISIACVVIATCLIVGCKPEPTGFPLSVATLQRIDSGSIVFEERQGKIVVSVTDKFGDSHIHLLNHDGMSKAEALAILKRKQVELKTRNPNQVPEDTARKLADPQY